MIYSPSTTAALGIVEDAQPEEPLTLRGEGLWVCLISSGKCVVSLSDLELIPAGSALLLPPQNAAAGHLVLSRGQLTLAPENECHLLCVQLTGQAAEQFLAGLSEMPFLARGETCPAAAELMGRLAEERDASERVRSQLAFALLCELSDADSAAPALPPLVAAAIEDIRKNYAGLYGVEELSERLGVSKSHLVRAFTAALGVSPGRYLTSVRIEAAMRLLLLRLAGNVAVAAYGVVANYALVATAIFNGVAQGAQPLVSRCYGKNDAAGARKLLLLGSGTALALAAALYAVLFGFTGPIVAVFNSENSALMAQYAFSGMRIYFLGYFFAGFNIVAAGYLGAVDRPAEASATSLSRGIVAIVACSLVLSALFGMNGVWAAFPASEAITACLTLFLLKRKKRTA